MDRRIAKTQKALIEALGACLSRHPWEDISVQMLCDTADVSRSTFYAHFDGKSELLSLAMDFISRHLVADDDGARGLDLNGKLAILPALLRHMRGHLFMFETTQASMAGRAIAYQFEQSIRGIVEAEISASRFAKTVTEDETVFLIGGLFALLDQWRIAGCALPDAAMLDKLDLSVRRVLDGGNVSLNG